MKRCKIVNSVDDACYLEIDDEGTIFQFAILEDEVELIENACKVYADMMRKRDLPKKMMEWRMAENKKLEDRKARYATLTPRELTDIHANHCKFCGTQRCMGIYVKDYAETCSAIDDYI
ncbi:MAG: hypothetical protein PHN69_04975 [Candidatus Pacebacteria bacterium]|nr:hypothetical protein [Candidatus Paceibacterota bacterium]